MKQLSENVWEFDQQIYPQLLWVAVNPTKEEQKQFLSTYTPNGEEEKDLNVELESCNAVVYGVRKKENKRTGSMIVFESKDTINFNIVAHESLHVVCRLCAYCAIPYDNDNHEHIAYLIGWVASCCEKIKKEYDNRS